VRVVVLPADNTGCGTLRLLWPAQVAAKVRPDWKVEVYEPASVKVATDDKGRLIKMQGIPDPWNVDMVVMQRIGMPPSLQLLQWFAQQGTAVVVDSDDAMWAIERDNIAFNAWNGGSYHWKWLDKACETADLVTVTTERLARRYGRHGRVEVLPNCVPEAVFSLESRRGEFDPKVTIGWSGFVATHPGDLRAAGTAVHDVVQATGAAVRVIGDARGAESEWGLPEGTVEQAGPFKLGPDYYQGLTTVDVAAVPLQDSTFNHAKSWLKALEFSAMGVPVVASATEDNRRLARTVPIILADSESEFREGLRLLVEDEVERRERGAAAREAVAANFTFEQNAEKWASAWERAVARKRKLVGV